MNEKIEVPTMQVPPLKKICMTIGQLPSSYIETMSYYEMLVWFVNYLRDDIIPVVNANGEATHELQELYVELQQFVNDSFDELNLQKEVDAKIDAMIEDGTLESLLNDALHIMKTYNTVDEMLENASGFVDGLKVKTLGYSNIDDNGGAIYEITNEELTPDGHSIIDLENGLFAKLIKDNSVVNYYFPKGWSNSAGNGDITLIKAYGKNILIDTYRSSNYSDVLTFLNDYDAEHIDYLILSHYHDDHVGNFNNLLTNDYIDENTIIFLPAYSELMSESALEYYNSIAELISEHNLQASVPTENSSITIGTTLKITFYNCETTIFEDSGYTDYNDCSTVCLIEHNNAKSLFTGDCLTKASNRLVDEGLIKSSVNLYKLSHHGINDGLITTYFKYINVINPEYAIQLSSLNDAERGKYSTSSQLYYLEKNKTRIYSSHLNTENIIFESSNDNLYNINGLTSDNVANIATETNLYVNVSTTNRIQNGTEDYPFKELAQAFGQCQNTKARYIFHLSNGSYNLSNHINMSINGCDVEIIGNTNDNTQVVIYTTINVNETNLKIKYCTISNENGSIALFNNNTLILDHCIVTNLTEKAENGIWTEELKHNTIIAQNCTFSSLDTAISAKYCDVCVYSSTFNNVTNALNLSHCRLIQTGNTFTSVTTKLMNNETTSLLPNQRVLLADSIDVKTGNITLSENITSFNKLVVISGYLGAGTMMGSDCYSYGEETFGRNHVYNAKSMNDDIIISVTNDAKIITITRSSGTPDLGIRKIYGYKENTQI